MKSEPLWCDVRQHYCRCHDFGKRCEDYADAAPQDKTLSGVCPEPADAAPFSNAASQNKSEEK